MIKTVILDCFGVVVTDTLVAAYRSLGGDFEKDQDFIRSVIDAANKGLIPNSSGPISERLGVSEDTWKTAVSSGRNVDLELLDFVKKLQPEYKTAMLSNISKGGLDRLFEDGFLDEYFDLVVASAEIGYAKPEAGAYEYVADKLGVRLDECVFTDDRQEYIDGALKVGMQAFLYTGFNSFKSKLNEMLSKNAG